MLLRKLIATMAATTLGLIAAQAGAVTFSSASATFEQSFDAAWTAAKAIDGDTSSNTGNGWAIFDNTNSTTSSQTALFTLQSPLAAGAYTLTYTLTQNYGTNHTLDTFSLAYTTAAGPVLASLQTLVGIDSAISGNGATMNLPSLGNIDVSGLNPLTDVYTITATINAASPLTGLFLNVIDNAGAGPGRNANGNFVLSEFSVVATPVPEPDQWALILAGLSVVGVVARRRRN